MVVKLTAHQPLAVLFLLAFVVSCSRGPKRIPMPKIDPAAAEAKAFEAYDKNTDGVIDAQELEASPPLLAAIGQIDRDADGQINKGELTSRIESWLERKQALHVLPCQVYLRGRELMDAEVRFIPEPFLGDAFRVATGTTDDFGTANIAHAPEDRPDPEFPQGVRIGYYRVEISKMENGKEAVPKKYNTESELGQEIAADAAGLQQGMLTFRLQ